MDGYKIIFINENGLEDETWLGKPMSSFSIENLSSDSIISLFFKNAHPNCNIISIEPCKFEELQK